MKLCWLDLRKKNDLTPAVLEEAVHQRLDGVVASSVADLADLPPTVKKVLFPDGPELPEDFGQADIVIVTPEKHGEPAVLAARHPGVEFGRYVEIVDAATLEVACQAAATGAGASCGSATPRRSRWRSSSRRGRQPRAPAASSLSPRTSRRPRSSSGCWNSAPTA